MKISKAEFLDPDRGLLAHIRREFYQDPAARASEAIPDIREDKNKWFEHFDYDGNGTLEQDEIVRALIKTFKLSDDRTAEQIGSVVAAVWPIFDTDGSGEIDKREFACSDGLADSIIASMDP